MTIARRKSEHLRIVAEEDVLHAGSSLLDNVRLMHRALPELDMGGIDTSVDFFGKRLRFPLMITSMTGGAEFAGEMNRGLAEVAAQFGIAFAVGSQRVVFRHPEANEDFEVRRWIPDGVLLGNIGVGELKEYSPSMIMELVSRIEADGICIHLNVAQEIVQEEGHRDFTDLTDAIARLVDISDGRVLVKETGAGIDPQTLKRLAEIGVTYVDVSGSGGTSWTKVEKYRSSNRVLRQTGEIFSDWGIPTAFSVLAARRLLGENCCIIGSGGIYSGLDAARAIALGADIAGFARPILLAFLDGGVEKASAFIEGFVHELKTAMLLTGSADVKALQSVPRIYTSELRQWIIDNGWLGDKEL